MSTTTKLIVKRVDSKNKKTTDKNVRIANAIEGVYDLACGIDGHVQSMGVLECIKNIDGYTPNSPELEEVTDAMWMIAESSTDSYEEAIGVITCAQFELHSEFSRSHVEMNGFIKNQN